jgi:site-specific recombinase XerD
LINPVREVPVRQENNRIVYLEQEEEARIRDAILDSAEFTPKEKIQYEAEIDLALNTGLRQSEQFRLRWTDVDKNLGLLGLIGKNGELEYIEINSAASSALDRLWEVSDGHGYVVPTGTEAPRTKEWRRWFAEIVIPSAKQEKTFGWHGLIHTFVTRLLAKGVPIRVVQELARHKDINTTLHYAHIIKGHKREAIERLCERKDPTGTKASTKKFDVVATENQFSDKGLIFNGAEGGT